jgi:uncharacterized protein YutE (UPF0331/DUF86 family)
MNRDIYLNKSASIRACLGRIREKYDGRAESLEDLDRQEIILLNLQRACELSIDLAMHAVAEKSLGIPQQSRDAFGLLVSAGILDPTLGERLQNMVGFRNIAIHRYQDISLPILARILSDHLGVYESFLDALKP